MTIKSELQQFFFNLIAKVIENKDTKSTSEIIIEEFYQFFEADFLSAYILFDEKSYYHLLGSKSRSKNLEPVLYLPQADRDKVACYFNGQVEESDVQIISFDYKLNVDIVIVLVKKEPLSEEYIEVLTNEGKKLGNIFAEREMGKYYNKSSKFLLDISTKLMKSNDKQIVLAEIDHALKDMYPDYPYYLILTQEYTDIDDLPIKTMDYSNENPENIVPQVFMTGEMKLKRLPEKSKKVVYTPLLGEQSVYGVLEITFPKHAILRKEELKFIYEFSVLAGKALEKTILYENSLLQVNNLTFLNEIIHELNSARELTEITTIVRKKMVQLSKADEVGFIYFNENAEIDFDVLDGSTNYFQSEEGLQVALRLKTVIDEVPEPIFSGNFTRVPINDYHSLMVFPMLQSGTNHGFIVALGKQENFFTFDNFKLIKTLIQHSSLAMANTILTKQLELSVITDHLTKLYSRKYLEEQIELDMELGSHGVLILFDIDDFKKVNDKYGHQVGDEVLKQGSRVLKKAAGKESIAARWGGEELAIYVPAMTQDEGRVLANTIRKAVANQTNPAITVSGGVSDWQKGDDNHIEKLFLETDNALYRAKAAGKNQVMTHN